MLSGDLKWGAFRAAELFCLPSHQENFGIVVAEALACGLPVAIAEPVNIASEVAAAAAGLVHADTAVATTEALRQWLALPAAEQAQMGQRGLQLFQERFDFVSVARHLLPVLRGARSEPHLSIARQQHEPHQHPESPEIGESLDH
jgi:glycosyltransferase involved in cell wall biosynthesis